ncbi:MAG: hypothetical protein JW958_13950 [Candidatus Eisenbacteria bacterium]|nr:hypothetical protein [Candidatus Eisenbacteria bacterium]
MRARPVLLAAIPLFLAAVEVSAALPRRGEEWYEVRSADYTLFSNAPRSVTRETVRNLDMLRAVLGVLFHTMEPRSPDPTYLYLLRDEDHFSRYVKIKGWDETPAGVFFRRADGNYMVVNAGSCKDRMRIVYHEYFHHFVHNNVRVDLPPCFDEGMAEYYSTFHVRGDREVEVGIPIEYHVHNLRRMPAIPMMDLFSANRGDREFERREERTIFYGQSWALMHYLLSRPDREERIEAFLHNLEEGKKVSDAVRLAFDVSITDLEKDLSAYVWEGRFPYQVYTFNRLEQSPDPVLRRMEYVEVLARLGSLMARMEDSPPKDVIALLEGALKRDTENRIALTGMGLFHMAADRHGEAAAYLRRAAAECRDYDAHLYYGINCLERARASRAERADSSANSTGALLDSARASFRICMEEAPGRTAGYGGLGETYLEGDDSVVPGIQALLAALRIAPNDDSIALRLLLLFLRYGAREDAEALERTRLRYSRDPEIARTARLAMVEDRIARALAREAEGFPDEAIQELEEERGETRDPGLDARLQEALAEIRGRSPLDPNEVLLRRAQRFIREGNPSGARELLLRVIETAESDELRARAHAIRDRIDQAAGEGG